MSFTYLHTQQSKIKPTVRRDHGESNPFIQTLFTILFRLRAQRNPIVYGSNGVPKFTLVNYPVRESEYKIKKYPTWYAGGTSVSKTSWGTPVCGLALNTERCPGPSGFTFKCGVDIALNTFSCLLC